jgi:D-arabinonate dehydratase
MKITSVECVPLVYPYEKPIYDALFVASQRQAALVKVTTDTGIVGWGEAASFGGPLESTKVVIEKELGPRLIGEDPFNIERIWKMLYSRSWQHGRGGIVICAISGVDIALWDIIGKSVKTPLYKLWGAFTDRVPAYASSGFYRVGKNAADIAAEMESYVAKGFRAVKMKVGRNKTSMNPLEVMPDPDFTYDLETDLERVEAVKKAVGPKVKLLVDANAAWDLHTALTMGRHFDRIGVYAFEEPVSTDNIDASAHLADQLDLKIAGYESEQLLYNFSRLITRHAVDIVQPDLTWGGGATECRKIAAFAAAYHKEVAPHCFSSAVCLAASLHFLCSVPNGGMLEMDRNPNGLRTDIVSQPLDVGADGFVRVPDKPGLGIEINEEAIEKYRLRD